jgi:hypothetical protein
VQWRRSAYRALTEVFVTSLRLRQAMGLSRAADLSRPEKTNLSGETVQMVSLSFAEAIRALNGSPRPGPAHLSPRPHVRDLDVGDRSRAVSNCWGPGEFSPLLGLGFGVWTVPVQTAAQRVEDR